MVPRADAVRREPPVEMLFQRCPICRDRHDVSVYVHGQSLRCQRCGLRFTVDRAHGATRVSDPASAGLPTELPTQVSMPPGDAPALKSSALLATPAQRPQAARPGSEAADANAPPAPPQIPGYECMLLLGRGGMGEVWKARQLSLQRTVAVKILAPTLAVEPDFVRRFERESSALAAMAHPHIVAIIDRGSANGHWYFVMEYVEGRSLRDRVADSRPGRTELLRLLAQVARAIDYAHQKGVIHRDLKPENVLIDHAGTAKVADFGLAGMSEVGRSALTMTAVAMGTAHYMAPEQRRDAKNVDGRADLYSLGVMLYELLTNELPVGRFPTPREKVPDLDPRLDSMILRLLDQDPDRRPSRASEVAELLERFAALAPERPEPTTRHGPRVLPAVMREVRANTQKKLMAGAAAALLVLIVAVALGSGGYSARGTGQLAAKLVRDSKSAELQFGAPDAAAGTLQVIGEGWRIAGAELVREAAEGSFLTPTRALLAPVRLDIADAAIEAEIVLEGAPLATGGPPPAAELVLFGDEDRHVGLRLALGPDGRHALFFAAPGKNKTLSRTEVTSVEEGQQARTGTSHHLELYVKNGLATALVDRQVVASAAVAGLSAGTLAQAALGCQRVRCRFTNVRLAGRLADPPSPDDAKASAQR